MKRADEVLSVFFDERLMRKAQGYSRLFASWADITAKNGIAAAADHSRIKELERGILLIEADHPGWKQILQTKQSRLLDDFRRWFPGLDISGISLMLGKAVFPKPDDPAETPSSGGAAGCTGTESAPENAVSDQAGDFMYRDIKDGTLKETLKRLERSIALQGKK